MWTLYEYWPPFMFYFQLSEKKPEGRSVERIPPPPTLTLPNLITSSPVAKGMIDYAGENNLP